MIDTGSASPLGATVTKEGVNFSVYSRSATGMDLLLFDRVDSAQPSRTIPLNPVSNRTYHYWHVSLAGILSGQLYGYRAHGKNDNQNGLRFDSSKILLDPYGRGMVIPESYSPQAIQVSGDDASSSMKSVVVDSSAYDWEGDVPLHHPSARTCIYEMHVRGFTRHPNSGVGENKRGTFAGLIEKIPYLQDLGITAVELLPIFAFDPFAAPPGKTNYWGYQPVSYFSPHPRYSSRHDVLGPINEFRDMVKALHRANIEVILDVVFNHTAEGNEQGPTLSFRGIDNPTYYILEQGGEQYANYSGCGNTLQANHPVVRRLIVDSLRYWVSEMHVDGFRFDLASILSRDASGQVLPQPPVLWDIESDPVLAGTKLIAEAWDAAGLYQVGSFVGDAWKEWNGRFRDDARDFFRGQPGAVARFADRMLGSHNIYGHKSREAEQSINFVTCHDGFTLNDLVTYNEKHNERNGEENRDGDNDNKSWNCGMEGPTSDLAIEQLRNRQVKNFLAVTQLSLGLPMISMGDEVCRTQAGNNNPYCIDDESNWFDWSLVDRHADIHRFVRLLLARRLLRSQQHENQRISLTELIGKANKVWHGRKLHEPDWSDASRSIAFYAELQQDNLAFHLILNAAPEPSFFELPVLPLGTAWRRWFDTYLPSPDDIVDWKKSGFVTGTNYQCGPHSVVMLFAERNPSPRT
jgi:isoamylase